MTSQLDEFIRNFVNLFIEITGEAERSSFEVERHRVSTAVSKGVPFEAHKRYPTKKLCSPLNHPSPGPLSRENRQFERWNGIEFVQMQTC